MKYILIIGDGMADNGIPELNGKTPLLYAKTPVMDKMASSGALGSVLTVPKGMPPGSDTAILSIFGCDPTICYGGRASLEAAATGIKLNAGDIAYRCNMVTFEDSDKPFESKKILSHSAGAIEGDVADTLVSELWETPAFSKMAKKLGVEIYPSGSFRHIMVRRLDGATGGGAEKAAGGGTAPLNELPQFAPPHDHIGEQIGQLFPQNSENATELIDLSRTAHEILHSHPINIKRRKEGKLPANGIWFWAAGVATVLPSFREKYKKTGSVISAVPLTRGIGTLMGLDVIIVQGATGDLHTNYEGKVNAAYESLRTQDFTTIHIEAPDECTHDGDLKGKLQAIEWVDSRVIAPLAEKLRDSGIDFRMLVISDHKTLLSTRGHAGEPVPFLIYDSRTDKGGAVPTGKDRPAPTGTDDTACAAPTDTDRANQNTEIGFCEKNAELGEYIADGTKLMGMLFDDNYKNR